MEYKLTRVKLEKEKDERQCSQNQIFFFNNSFGYWSKQIVHHNRINNEWEKKRWLWVEFFCLICVLRRMGKRKSWTAIEEK